MTCRFSAAVFVAAWWCVSVVGAVSPRYSGTPIAQVFTERDVPGSPQTRSVLAHPNGFIYVANTEGLVEFDGVAWTLVPGTRGLIVHNVQADTSGRIWFSGTGEFGFLAPDDKGVLTAFPQHEGLASKPKDVGHILRMLVHGEQAYFVTQGTHNAVVRAGPRGELREFTFAPGERPVSLFLHEDVVHVITTAGVHRLVDDTLRSDPAAGILSKLGVQSVWPRTEGGAWVISAAGLRLWNRDDAPLVSEDVPKLLGDDRVSCGCPLGDGTFALGTEKNGVLLVEASTGRVLARYDDEGGLGATSSTIVSVTLDAQGGLWLAHFAGVTRIQMKSPAALHTRAAGGVRGRVQGFAFHRGRLHVATTLGVLVRDPQTGRFGMLPGASGDSWVLLSTEDGLIVGGPDLRLIRDDGSVEIIEQERLLFRSAVRLRREPDRLVACTGPGLVRVYRREGGKWRFEAGLPNIRASLYPIIEDADGRLWATRNRLEVVRIDWRAGVRLDAQLESVGTAEGLPFSVDHRSRVWIFLVDGSVEVTTWEGLWRHDRAGDRFAVEDRIAGLDSSRWSRAFPLSDGSLWLANTHARDAAALARKVTPGRWVLEPQAYTGLEAIRPLELCDDPSTHTLWIGYLGLSSIDRDYVVERAPPPAVRLRSIVANGQQLLWGGAGSPPAGPFGPEHRSLQFSFAAPSLQPDAHGTVKTEFRTRLDKFDSAWSAWSDSARRQYSNLPPGDFALHVQARDNGGREGPETVFAFKLLPPWWRTWWAHAGYVGLGAAAIGALVRLRTRALHRRTERLENVVAERTQTLSEQNQELARLHRLELDEKITARLAAEKSRLETLRYQLNPHFLFNSLASIRSQIPLQSVRAREAVERLADFCRATLHDRRGDEFVSVGEEIAMLRSYLDIELSRLGELLTVQIDVDSAVEREKLPRLLLLPLVENALKYGAATSPDRVQLRLSARHASGKVEIEIANTGTWVERSPQNGVPSLGIGHDNIRERLERYYPGRHAFGHRAADGWVVVRLVLPLASAS